MSDNDKFLLHICPHCEGHIEFPAYGVGREFKCPLCRKQTILTHNVQPKVAPQKSTNVKTPEKYSIRAVMAPMAAVVISAVIFFCGPSVADSINKRACQDIKAELVALKIGLRDGVTLQELRAQRKKLNVAFELKKGKLPRGLDASSLLKLNNLLSLSEYFWEKKPSSHIDWDEARFILEVLGPKEKLNEEEKLDLYAAKLAMTNLSCDRYWDPGKYAKKALLRCGDETERLLAKFD